MCMPARWCDQSEYFRTEYVARNEGLRYPHRERTDNSAPSRIDTLYATRK